ncbi:MAG: putative lipid II flippase FtsW [Candidatus Dadabacteria bacterium]|nr:putative lipid II flippase FtsW [Candidatus Dadabacteria bacterium]NIS10271.1 putative lipid II flippase FtsW [Candidatus Dadabacteria bacterium]NIY23197.1 putative lipid II flippase FtsW [Candidatus Dadabacteria bacterium]
MKNTKIDFYIVLSVLYLTSVGLLMVYSTSSIYALDKFNDSSYYLKRHLIFLGAGLFFMTVIANINYVALKKIAFFLYLAGLICLILVLVPQIGKEVGGARRWIDLGMFSFQPTEVTKYFLVVYLAHLFSKNKDKPQSFSTTIVPYLLIAGFYVLLMMMQPDFGMVVILLAMFGCMMFIAEVNFKYIFGLGFSSLVFISFAVISADYRMNRIFSFIDPWKDPLGQGYQTVQSFVAFCIGGFTGTGLGEGTQKLYYLPQVHTDFIFSLIGEELGFIGVLSVITAFVVLIVRGFKTAANAPDFFGFFLAFGCIILIALQASINMAVSVGVFPTKGLTLPFISYGGSSLMSSLGAIGLVLSVSKKRVT